MKKIILEKIYNGYKMNYEESKKLFNMIIQKKLTSEEIVAVIISMKIRGENFKEIAAAASIILKNAKFFPKPNYSFADISGTGGDKKNSINISTVSAFIAAGCGVPIAKHSNKSISSILGSSDVLSQLGIKLKQSAQRSRKNLDNLNLCFLFAPYYYKSFQNIQKIRKILNTSTIFNILGPIINPARPPITMIGVYNEKFMLPIAKTLKILGTKRAAIIYGSGMDEVILHDVTKVIELHNKKFYHYSLSSKDFGLPKCSLNDILLQPKENTFNIIINLLQGKAKFIYKSIVAANVALLLKLFGYEDLKKNTLLALKEINSGYAYKRMLSLIKYQK